MKNKFKMNNGYRVWGIPACLAEAGRGYRENTHPASPLRNSMEFQGPKSRKSFRFLGGTPHPKFQFGFTLIELMAVVAIIMILAAIMIPNVAKNVERGREGRAVADIDVLVKAVDLFHIDHGYIPGKLNDLWTDKEYGPYIASEEDLETPWGGEYKIELLGTTGYKITAYKGEEEKVFKTIKFGVSN